LLGIENLISIRNESSNDIGKRILRKNRKFIFNGVVKPNTDILIADFTQSLSQERIDTLRSIDQSLRNEFKDRDPSISFLTTTTVLNTDIYLIEETAKELFRSGIPQAAIAFTDIAIGAHQVGIQMSLANSKTDAQKFFSSLSNDQKIDFHINNEENHRLYNLMYDMLERNPSGLPLLDELVSNFKGKPTRFNKRLVTFPDPKVKEFIIHGAELFQKFYKLTYPLAANLQQPQK
jgi:hypothetical protein